MRGLCVLESWVKIFWGYADRPLKVTEEQILFLWFLRYRWVVYGGLGLFLFVCWVSMFFKNIVLVFYVEDVVGMEWDFNGGVVIPD